MSGGRSAGSAAGTLSSLASELWPADPERSLELGSELPIVAATVRNRGSVQPCGPNRCNAGLIAVAIMLAVGVCDGCGEEADSAAHHVALLAGCISMSGVLAGMWHLLLAYG